MWNLLTILIIFNWHFERLNIKIPFLKLLKKIRANNSANLALLQEDMIDEDFEKHKEQDVLIKNPIDQFNKSNYFKNDIDE